MSADSSGAVPLCNKCDSPLRYDIVCSSCGCIGEDESHVRRCKQCYGYMYENSSICLWCGHNRAFPASKKPCILCCNLLPLNNNNFVCETCQTPQDMDVLKDQLFKKCLNFSCSAIVSIHASNCYQCNYQQDPSIPGLDLFSSGIPSYLQTQLQVNSLYKPNVSPTASSQTNKVHHDTSSSAERKVKNTSVESKAGMKKCIFCENSFSEHLEKCTVCSALQDVEILKTLQFNNCTSGCGAILCVEFHKFCFRCKGKQGPLSTFSGLEVFPLNVLNPSMSAENLVSLPDQDGRSVAKTSKPNVSPTASSQTNKVHHDTSSSAERKVKNTSVESKAGMKKCIFCENSFSEHLEKCTVCSALQDVEILKTLQFNNCTSGCGAILCVEFHKFCFRCKGKQGPLSTFSGLEVFPLNVLNPSMSAENLVPLPDQDGHSAAKKSGSGKPLKKPCVLCTTEIHTSSTHCFTCQTTQIEDALKHSLFKLCSNTECKAPMPADSTVCYRCKQDQRVTFPTKSMLYHEIFPNTADSSNRGESSKTCEERVCIDDIIVNSYDILDSTKDSSSQSQSQMHSSSCEKSVGNPQNSNITISEAKSHDDQQRDDGKNDKGVNGGMNASSDLQKRSEESKKSVNDASSIPQDQSNHTSSKEASGPGEKPQKPKALQKQSFTAVSYLFYIQGMELIIYIFFLESRNTVSSM